MNAAETIQAAIDRLIELKEANANYGEWSAKPGLPKSRVVAEGNWVAETRSRWDAELIVMLHRTTDAQLAILRDTEYRYAAMWEKEPDRPIIATSGRNALDLAKAILGGAK